MGDHDCINALAAREIRQTGEWLIPQVAEIPWVRKPPLGAWTIAAASWLLEGDQLSPHVSEYSSRFPSALAGWGTVMLIVWLGRQLYGQRTGSVCGMIAAVSTGIVFFAHSAQVDMVLTFFTTLAFALFWRGAQHPSPSRAAMIGFYAAFAIAMMAKAPLPLVTVGLALAVYWFVTAPLFDRRSAGGIVGDKLSIFGSLKEQFAGLRRLSILPGIVVFLLVAGSWPLYVYLTEDNALALWKTEYLDRFTGAMSDKTRPAYYYVPIIFLFCAPYLLSLPEAFAGIVLPRYRKQRAGLAYAWTWLVIGLGFLSASAFKRPHYVISLIPACCLLLGPVIDRLFFGEFDVRRWSVRLTCRLIPIVLATSIIVGGVVVFRKYPELFRGYVLATAVAFSFWLAAGVAFGRNLRRLAFASLNVGVVFLLILFWPNIVRGFDPGAEGDALVAAFKSHEIAPDDPIFQVDDRPDASIEFYHGYRIRRLINELEMTDIRTSRGSTKMDMYALFAKKIEEALSQPDPVYLILKNENLTMLEDSTNLKFTRLFQIEGFHEDPGDDPVVISQANESN